MTERYTFAGKNVDRDVTISGGRILVGVDNTEISCDVCGKYVVCPHIKIQGQRDSIDIRGLEGWTTPPIRCPECSAG